MPSIPNEFTKGERSRYLDIRRQVGRGRDGLQGVEGERFVRGVNKMAVR